ncbi:MAG: PEP-CTERM sorting domain-containing protein [Chthoniobacterales bacterium]|jgi:hypothetical protein
MGQTVVNWVTNGPGSVVLDSGIPQAYLSAPGVSTVVSPGTNGIYTQNQPPFQPYFFNSGRNVLIGFDMLYDGAHGSMRLHPNSYGAVSTNVFFAPQAGGFPNQIPEPSTVALVLIGLVALGAVGLKRHKD